MLNERLTTTHCGRVLVSVVSVQMKWHRQCGDGGDEAGLRVSPGQCAVHLWVFITCTEHRLPRCGPLCTPTLCLTHTHTHKKKKAFTTTWYETVMKREQKSKPSSTGTRTEIKPKFYKDQRTPILLAVNQRQPHQLKQ